LNCPVEMGSLLSVELPGASDGLSSTVLAYVVRVNGDPGSEWSVGCTFATELNDDDLEPFGAKRVKANTEDQRTWVRFPCAVEAKYQFVKTDQPTTWTAKVVDLSANGVGLQVDQHLDLGKLLNLELRGDQGNFVLTILACVVRITAQGDGPWAVGCNLIRELTDQELKALLSHR